MNGRIHALTTLALGLALGPTAHAQDAAPGAAAPAMARVEPAPAAAPIVVIRPERRESPWKEHPLAVEGQLAMVGPLGGAGLALDLALSDWFAINGGVGIGRGAEGSSVGERLQYAITPRLRIPLGSTGGLRLGVGIELGVSEGSYKEVFGCSGLDRGCVNDAWKSVVWQNTNLAFEIRQDRFQFRLFSGVATPLSSDGTRSCERNRDRELYCADPPSERPWKLFNLGLALGIALW